MENTDSDWGTNRMEHNTRPKATPPSETATLPAWNVLAPRGFSSCPDSSDDETEQGPSTSPVSCLSASGRPSGSAKAASVLATWGWGWNKDNHGLLLWGQMGRQVKSTGFLTGWGGWKIGYQGHVPTPGFHPLEQLWIYEGDPELTPRSR